MGYEKYGTTSIQGTSRFAVNVKSIQVLPKVVVEDSTQKKLNSLNMNSGNQRSCETLTIKSVKIIIDVVKSGSFYNIYRIL